ncbi:hypothetical protein pah_c026o053 [Parachlamydia acanthamoebae str. Hall's coccus]|nr:hypothetical protein pah_c026o053 [Parachlamydia acanthamoebae str. Hall's coccus]
MKARAFSSRVANGYPAKSLLLFDGNTPSFKKLIRPFL